MLMQPSRVLGNAFPISLIRVRAHAITMPTTVYTLTCDAMGARRTSGQLVICRLRGLASTLRHFVCYSASPIAKTLSAEHTGPIMDHR